MLASRSSSGSKSGEGRISGSEPGLLVGRAARVRLAEHRLRLGVRIALLAARAEAPVVALAHRLDGRVQAEDDPLALTLGAALAAGVEQP
jgi:hypothetical protein